MGYDYYEMRRMRSGGIYRICCVCCAVIVTLLAVFVLCGCKAKKSLTEKTDTQDSVRIEYVEKVVKVPVTVYVEVPVEQKEKLTKDSTSILETTFAVSEASMVWIGGVPFLRHSLANKAQKIAKTDTVPVVEKEKTIWKTRRVTYTKTEIREKQLAWWQRELMYSGVAFYMLIILYLCVRIVRCRLRR